MGECPQHIQSDIPNILSGFLSHVSRVRVRLLTALQSVCSPVHHDIIQILSELQLVPYCQLPDGAPDFGRQAFPPEVLHAFGMVSVMPFGEDFLEPDVGAGGDRFFVFLTFFRGSLLLLQFSNLWEGKQSYMRCDQLCKSDLA